MDQPSLDDQLKQAQIEKTSAEARKLDEEATAVRKKRSADSWSDAIKVVGAIILGAGGAIAAYTQYEVSELKAKIAQDELSKAQAAKLEAEKAASAAEAAASAALATRDSALQEQGDAELAVAELKATLSQTNSDLRSAKPNQVEARLAYMQFRGDLTRGLINDLRKSLAAKRFNAPGAERVTGEYQNSVKYFKPSESADAQDLASAVESFFAGKGCPLKMSVVPASSSAVQNPPLEVWLAHKCSGR